MDIGGKIRCLRHQKNYTQEELSVLLNVSPQAISRWECGISLPDITTIPKLAEIFAVSCDELLKDSIEMKIFPSCEKLVILGELLNQEQINNIFTKHDIATGRTKKNVLIVDDSDFMRMMVKDMLTKLGHSIWEADNGINAHNVLLKEKIDVCILDIRMPGMNGMDALEQYRKEFPDVKMIMLSALSVESIVKKAYELGASAFIAKPFQADSLINSI